MNINGHRFREHLQLLAPLFAFIAAVWALRLVLDLAGAPESVFRVVSVTAAEPLAVLLAVVMIHHRRFGGYSTVILAAFLLACWQQLLIMGAIAFAALTQTSNVYSEPEFSGGDTPLRHIFGHLTFGIGAGTLFGVAMGVLVFWMLRRTAPARFER